jgi:hypothetical protein
MNMGERLATHAGRKILPSNVPSEQKARTGQVAVWAVWTPESALLWNEQDALFIFSLFRLRASTCFEHIFAHNQKVLYVQQLVYFCAEIIKII